MRFRVLGPVEVHLGDGRVLTMPRRQERCLLAILLLDAGRTVPTERLSELLWENNPPRQARQAIRTHVARIRAMLAQIADGEREVGLDSDRGGYLLTVAADAVDAHRFRRLVDQAGHTDDLVERERLLREALALWHGPALHNAASDRTRQRLCADLEELRLHAIEESLATGLELGRHRELLPELTRLTREHPLREGIIGLHMRALHESGRTADALDVYTSTRVQMADQLGLDPSRTLRQLHQSILRGEPVPTPQPSRPAGIDIADTAPAQLPADLSGFAGRTQPLRRLDAVLPGAGDDAGPMATTICAIAGTAGVGKTTLAVHWAHRIRDRFPDGQLFVNLRGFDPTTTPVPPAQVIRQFLVALNVAPQRVPADTEAQIGLYRSLLAGKRLLVVLDNARDPEQVRPLLPGAPGCLALVTSRNQLTGLVAIDGAHPLTLDLLTADEARQLLAGRLGADRVTGEPEAVDDLIDQCARLPLALAIAAAGAATRPTLPLASVAAQIRTSRTALDALTGDDTATDLRAVFACSYRTISPPAARLFRLLALHPGPDTAVAAAASLAGISPEQAKPLLTELSHAQLIAEPTIGRYAFHDLLRAYASEQTTTHETQADRAAALHRILDHYLHTAHAAARLRNPDAAPLTLPAPRPGVTAQTFTDHAQAATWMATEQPVLLTAVRQAAATGFDTHTWQLARSLASLLTRHDWATIQHAALDAVQRLADRPDLTGAGRYLARSQSGLDPHHDTHVHLQRTLDRYREAGDHAGQADTHLDVACALEGQGQYGRALDHAQQALDLYRATGHRRGQAKSLNAIGWYHALLGDHEQALVHCHQAITLHEDLSDAPR